MILDGEMNSTSQQRTSDDLDDKNLQIENTPYSHDEPDTQIDQPQLSTFKAVMLAGTMMLTYWMMAMSVSASLVMVPSMAKWYGVSELAVQWVASSFTLAYGSGLLLAGRFADLYGRKQLFIGGLALGLLANIASAVVPNRIVLCVVRAFAGLSLSMASPAGFGIVGVNFQREPSRTIAFAALGAGSPAGGSVGQVVSGIMSTNGGRSWQYMFYVIAGVNLIPIITGYLFIPAESARTRNENRKVDWLGAGLITLAIALLGFSITQSGLEAEGWREPYVPTVFSVSILLILAFGLWEHHVEHKTTVPPIIKLDMFTRHRWLISIVLIIAFLEWCGICGWVYLTSVYYQNLLKQTPFDTALHILPGPITGVLCSCLVIFLAPRVRAPILLIAGGILTGCLFAVRSIDTLYWKMEFLAAVCHPFGGDLTIPIGSILISNLCSRDEQSVAGALFQVSLQLAATIDICLSSFIHTTRQPSVGLLTALRESFWFNAACCWTAIPITVLFLRKLGLAKDVVKVV